MVIPARFERTAYRLGICRSILLSYGIAGVSHTGKRCRIEDRNGSDVFQRLAKVCDEVFGGLDADRETHQPVREPDPRAHIRRHGGVGR